MDGEFIAGVRERVGKTVEQFALDLGVSVSELREMENDERAVEPEVIERAYDLLDVVVRVDV